ncbi:hypothetical protein CP8484711_2160A, partial [Chlamydia psittaci 84-8471/1]
MATSLSHPGTSTDSRSCRDCVDKFNPSKFNEDSSGKYPIGVFLAIDSSPFVLRKIHSNTRRLSLNPGQ